MATACGSLSLLNRQFNRDYCSKIEFTLQRDLSAVRSNDLTRKIEAKP